MNRTLPARGSDWRVVSAGEAELDRVAALAALALDPPWSRDLFAGELAQAGARLWVARPSDEAELRGYVLVQRIADEVEIRSLAVEPTARRRGVATQLVLVALGHEGARGARAAHLEVRAGNAEARFLYARLGFQTAGRRPRYYPDGEDALLLMLHLEARDADATAEVQP